MREILAPTGLGLIVFTFVFLVGQLFKLAEILLNSGIPANIALELIALLLPGVLSITIPMALLVGILLGVGRLAADREILAVRASGISLVHLAIPIVVFSAIVSACMMWANTRLIPYLNLKGSDLKVQMTFHALSAIPAGTPFPLPASSDKSQTMTVLIDSKDPETGALQGVTLLTQMQADDATADLDTTIADLDTTTVKEALSRKSEKEQANTAPPEKKKKKKKDAKKAEARRADQAREYDELLEKPTQDIVILAANGVFEPKIEDRVVYIRLSNGSIQLTNPENPASYDIIQFDSLAKGIVPSFSKIAKGYFEKDPREMSLPELRQQIARRDKGRKYSTELYERFSVPLACIAFGLIAFPLAIYVRPTGKAVAFAISFLLILCYYGLLEYGVALNRAGSPLGPAAMLAPNVIIAAIGCFMLYRVVAR